MNFIVTFCEGPHDSAFLARILKTNFYKTYHIKISDYPYPLKEMFLNSLKNNNYEELNIEQISSSMLPRKILKKENNIILLYALGGNRQYDRVKNILEKFNDIVNNNSNNLIGMDTENSYNFIFFNDADEDLDEEVKKINTFLYNFYGKEFNIKHNDIKNKFGIYIFHENNKGTLENLLKEIVYLDNKKLFNDIEIFYNTHFDNNRLKRLKIVNQSGILVEKRESNFQKEYPLKAKINIAGQLQNSGVSQVVTIDKSDLITLNKLQNNKKVQEIIEFFKKVEI